MKKSTLMLIIALILIGLFAAEINDFIGQGGFIFWGEKEQPVRGLRGIATTTPRARVPCTMSETKESLGTRGTCRDKDGTHVNWCSGDYAVQYFCSPHGAPPTDQICKVVSTNCELLNRYCTAGACKEKSGREKLESGLKKFEKFGSNLRRIVLSAFKR